MKAVFDVEAAEQSESRILFTLADVDEWCVLLPGLSLPDPPSNIDISMES